MLIKPVDDKSRRIAFLLNLYDSPMLNAEQKKWLDDELWSSRRKFLAVETSASHIDACFGESKDFAVLHDLRLRLRDGAVRIDHLLLARNCAFVIETRNFEGNISIDARGDFTIQYGDGTTRSIAAPLRRGQRLGALLQEFFDAMDIKVRGAALPVYYLAMFPDDTVIRRSPELEFDTSNVINSHALKSWVEDMCSRHTASKLKSLWSREKDSLGEWGEKIVSHHHPDNPFYLPKSIRPPKRRKTADGVEVEVAATDLSPLEELQAQEPVPQPTEPAPLTGGGDTLLPPADTTQPAQAADDATPPEQATAPTDESSPEEAAQPPASATEDSPAQEATEQSPADAAREEAASSEAGNGADVPPAEQDNAPPEFSAPDAEAPTMFLERDDAEAPTMFLERDDAEAPTMFLEREAEVPTEYLETRAEEAPTEFLVRETPAAPAPEPAAAPAAPAGVSVCALCGRPLMRGMVKFCQEHPKRFGGKLYCFTHQDNFPPVPEEDA